jgi:hypothetical protein
MPLCGVLKSAPNNDVLRPGQHQKGQDYFPISFPPPLEAWEIEKLTIHSTVGIQTMLIEVDCDRIKSTYMYFGFGLAYHPHNVPT